MNLDNIEHSHEVKTPLSELSKSVSILDTANLNQNIEEIGKTRRDFGLNECSHAAKKIFTPEVIKNWSTFTVEERMEITKKYGEEVAKSFELVEYKGVVFENMEGKNGYNQGDGIAHISNRLVNTQVSPLQIVDTLTHELRHQYQIECIRGFHPISDETKKEWAIALKTYTSSMPWAENPWGYKYNPLEIDSRYAGESVVRNLTKDYINGKISS